MQVPGNNPFQYSFGSENVKVNVSSPTPLNKFVSADDNQQSLSSIRKNTERGISVIPSAASWSIATLYGTWSGVPILWRVPSQSLSCGWNDGRVLPIWYGWGNIVRRRRDVRRHVRLVRRHPAPLPVRTLTLKKKTQTKRNISNIFQKWRTAAFFWQFIIFGIWGLRAQLDRNHSDSVAAHGSRDETGKFHF